eukprot:scaffold293_cov135-Cylindrotheca_fusiformis.AAC.4
MSKSSSHPSDWSTNESNGGMSHQDSSDGGEIPKPMEYVAPDVANREQKAVTRSKFLVFFALLLFVCGAATATFLLMKDEERGDFEAAVSGLGSEVTTVIRQKVDQLFSAVDAYSTFVASEAKTESNSSWPFIYISDFSMKTEKIAALFGIETPSLVIAPFVKQEEKDRWTSYVLETAPLWYQESIDNEGINATVEEYMNLTIPFVHHYGFVDNKFAMVPTTTPGAVLPNWQRYPLQPGVGGSFGKGLLITNYDVTSIEAVADLIKISNSTLRPSIGLNRLLDSRPGYFDQLVVDSQIVQPIMDQEELVGVIWVRLAWLEFFQNLFVDGIFGTIVVIRSNCEIAGAIRVISFTIDGSSADFLGEFDAHDPKYDDQVVSRVIVELDAEDIPDGLCVPTLTLEIYPTDELAATFETSRPTLYTTVVVTIFAFTSLVFLLYDYYVARRQKKFMERIVRQDQIVSNVFPAAIRDRLYENGQKGSQEDAIFDPLGGGGGTAGSPLADLFPDTTIVFADIAGFTAWSSAREPAQVFILLETIYGAFDKHAYRRSVFKVETVGDCYVAVAGLPEPDKEHAATVCRFARDCVKTMKEITVKLEMTLGPDTSDLDLRVGIHRLVLTSLFFQSGQVTAGVLRGERSRFQLFGDTMNTAARMESTSDRNRIQVSQVTADLLVASGLSAWIIPRKSMVSVKGKGEMQTYWLNTKAAKPSKPLKSGKEMPTVSETLSNSSDSSSVKGAFADSDDDDFEAMTKRERLVEYNVEVLTSLMQQIIASRGTVVAPRHNSLSKIEATIGTGDTVLEEFVPIIPLKRFDAGDLSKRHDASSIDIGEEAKNQLRNFLTNVASMYRGNPFHNFEHASHVTASVKKLLTRIVNVDDGNGLKMSTDTIDLVDMAGHSYGITSDPLTQFSVVFSAIIHDMDHPGVPNAQLVKENTRSAQIFKKSVAEQNSVELAWTMLMGKEYDALRACIYHTEEDLRRFRQLVVNTVMATDIVDKELQALRKARWETAFADTVVKDETGDDCKATIVIEHLIQASDVSHTMQHWHIYKSWNQKFFMECYDAYKAGRADSDPSENWYKGEIGFFDFYVIPLAKKLDNCGVFGVSSHEYLSYARSNRAEWAREGEKLVQQYLVKYDEMTKP